MTIKKFQFAPDINSNNDLYVLSKKTKCLLSGVAYVWDGWEEKLETTEKSLGMLAHRLQDIFPSYSHWLFIGHRSWQPDNRIVRHRKLWSALAAKHISIPEGEKINEVIISSENGLKCFGMIKCKSIDNSALVSMLRSGWETQLIFADERVAMDASKFLLSNGYEHQDNAPSDKIVDLLCEQDIFAYLPLGWFDDRESGCALIAKEKLIISAFPECEQPRP